MIARQRFGVRVLAMLVFLLTFLPAAAQFQTPAPGDPEFCTSTSEWGGCAGECPWINPVCAWQYTYCGCTGPGGVNNPCTAIPIDDVRLGAVLSNTAGGPGWWSVGNSITLTQDGNVDVQITHSTSWSGLSQNIIVPDRTLSITVDVVGVDPSNPNGRLIAVSSVGAILPSYVSVALGGSPTGDNVFSLDPERGGTGWIDSVTGEFRMHVYAQFRNGIFSTEPAMVQANVFGTFDPALRIATIDNFGASGGVHAESSANTLW